MKAISFSDFDRCYRQVVTQIYKFWGPQMQEELARHNRGWGVGRCDFLRYLQLSVRRYHIVYTDLVDVLPSGTVCDVGGFWGAFPLTLARLGYIATMTDCLRYYGEAFTPLFDYIRQEGVRIIDYDPFDPEAIIDERFDAIISMAVMEHYPHSLQTFFGNLKRLVTEGGFMYFEVPNIAYWPKRVALLRGHSPHPPIDDVYHSRVPFTGHHREFSIHDLRRLMTLSGLCVLKEHAYNYSVIRSFMEDLWYAPIATLAYRFSPYTREVLSVLCRPEREISNAR